MNTAATSTVDKRRRHTPAAIRADQPRGRHLWRLRLQGWLRQLPQWMLHKTSLTALIEAQVKARTEQLFRQANYDALTHLPNRAFFMQTVEQTLKNAESTQTPFALLFLDLDGFKPVNDTYGHGAGDELLRLVAARLISSVRDYDFVARLGGDEFIILLRDVVDHDIIETISKRLIQEVSRPYWVNNRAVHISTSVGITEYPQDGKTVHQLMERADQALYVAKHRGRKQFCFYKDVAQMPTAAPDKLQTRFEVDVEHEKLAVRLRPMMALDTNQCIGARLNVLWQDAPLQQAWYEDWRTLLQRSQWSLSVGMWMIDSAAYYRSLWHKAPESFFVSVPLEMSLLMESDLSRLLCQRIEPYGVTPGQIELRIDLESLYKLDQKAIQAVQTLDKAGFRLRLSGLGAQNLEMALLNRMPIQAVALDGDWLQQQLNQPQGERWIRAISALATSLEAQVHADKVTTAQQAARLTQLGVHSGEGALWHDYLDEAAFSRLMAREFAA
jgi:diguanylate cyclase (GGDEF)-like protein